MNNYKYCCLNDLSYQYLLSYILIFTIFTIYKNLLSQISFSQNIYYYKIPLLQEHFILIYICYSLHFCFVYLINELMDLYEHSWF